jgi:hypothetical protein
MEHLVPGEKQMELAAENSQRSQDSKQSNISPSAAKEHSREQRQNTIADRGCAEQFPASGIDGCFPRYC